MYVENTITPTALLFDVDGTLTNSKREISLATQQVFQSLSHTTFKYGLSTGRSFAALKNYVLPHFPKNNLHIVAGGGQIITSLGEIIWENSITAPIVQEIITNVERLGGAVAFGKEDILYCSKSLYKNLKNHPWKFAVTPLNTLQSVSTPLVTVVQLNEEVRKYIDSLINLSAVLMGVDKSKQYFDITVAGVNKATTAQIWAKQQGISLDNTIAFGDGTNDYELFLAVGYGVAMGQSPELLKSVAKKIIEHTDHDSLAKYLTSVLELK